MAKKFVVKTTKEFTYDEKGFIIKEVVTEESYETEMYTGGTITSGTIKASDIKPEVLKKTTGILPNTGSISKSGIEVNGTVTTSTNKTITEIANEVKAILDRDLKRTPTTFI